MESLPFKIKPMRFVDRKLIKKMNLECSEVTKQQTFNFPELNQLSKYLFFLLSTTILKYILPVKYKTVVAMCDEKIVGYAFIRYTRSEKELGIRVSDMYQGKKIGYNLLDNILKGESNITLTVLESNLRAIKLYKKFDFMNDYTIIHMKKSN